jgi:hypothetical protein
MTAWLRSLGLAIAAVAVLAGSARAADPAPVTVTGRIACAMCVLKQKDVKTCTNVVVATEAGKEVVYGLADNAVSKAYEMKACEKAIPVKVTGTVTERGGKRTITASKIDRA